MAALVVADQPDLAGGHVRGQQRGDVVPGGLREGPAVRQHHGHRGVRGPVDGGVQLGAVGGRDGVHGALDGAAADHGAGHAAASVVPRSVVPM